MKPFGKKRNKAAISMIKVWKIRKDKMRANVVHDHNYFHSQPLFESQKEKKGSRDWKSQGKFGKMNLRESIRKRESTDEIELLHGYRLVDLRYVLNWALKLQLDHSKNCEGEFKVVGEERIGSATKIKFQCKLCYGIEERYTENIDDGK